jgi:hypothetical protein
MAKSSSSTFLALTVALLLMNHQALPTAHCARGAALHTPPALKGGRFGAAAYQRAPVLSDTSSTNPGPSPGTGHGGTSFSNRGD